MWARNGAAFELAMELLAQGAEAGAAVEDVEMVADAHFDAGGVASIAHVFGLGSRRRPTHAPELNTHTSPWTRFELCRHLPTAGRLRQFIRWLLSVFKINSF